tara:strand:+ start:3429 stop:4847 length:1419 start_codon:yes stop_codon:yes gene_type:complete
MTSITLQETELEILRKAVDSAEMRINTKMAQSEFIKDINSIVENFIREKKLICYGGTAINNILPVEDQFYNKDVDIPDYDFFSTNAIKHAKELADIYVKAGYTDVESKAGVHNGTYKVFVNFIPVADITFLDNEIYRSLIKEAIKVNGILYSPPNFLRMGMYLELSRPAGDVSRWEKVLKRLILLNKHYPLNNKECELLDFQREYEGNKDQEKKLYFTIRNSIIDQGLIFFGGYASTLYGKYMPYNQRKQLQNIPDFDILSEDPIMSSTLIKERLNDIGYKKIRIVKRKPIGELISEHYEIIIDKDTICMVYKPLACHSYNTIKIKNKIIKVASIDTMLSFYLAFLYANRPYFNKERLLCMAQYLFVVQSKNRLKQRGLLRRFSINCYGRQETMEDIRSNKAIKFQELKNKKNSKEYEEYFLRYAPSDKLNTKHLKKTQKTQKTQKSRKINKKKQKNTRKTTINNIKKKLGL